MLFVFAEFRRNVQPSGLSIMPMNIEFRCKTAVIPPTRVVTFLCGSALPSGFPIRQVQFINKCMVDTPNG